MASRRPQIGHMEPDEVGTRDPRLARRARRKPRTAPRYANHGPTMPQDGPSRPKTLRTGWQGTMNVWDTTLRRMPWKEKLHRNNKQCQSATNLHALSQAKAEEELSPRVKGQRLHRINETIATHIHLALAGRALGLSFLMPSALSQV